MHVDAERDVAKPGAASHDLSAGWSAMLCWNPGPVCHHCQGVL